jgi:hypothetical protein
MMALKMEMVKRRRTDGRVPAEEEDGLDAGDVEEEEY